MVRNFIEEVAKRHYRTTPSMLGRPTAAAANAMRPEKHKNTDGASERPQFTNVPNVMWVCAWCRVSPITAQKQICKAVYN